MATSSIIDRIRINNPKVMEAYIDALEKAEKEPVIYSPSQTAREVTDPEEMKQIMIRCIENWSKS